MESLNEEEYQLRNYYFKKSDQINDGTNKLWKVFRATDRQQDKTVVIKIICRDTLGPSRQFHNLKCKGINLFDHPQIMKMENIFDAEFKGQPSRCFVTEYFPDGDLRQYIQKVGEDISLEQCLDIFGQIYSACYYLNKLGLVHRRIQPSNILMQGNTCKLSNLTHVSKINEQKTQMDPSLQGQNRYQSLESLQSGIFNQKTSVWSLGMILYELLHQGHSPWPTSMKRQDYIRFLKKSRKSPFSSHIPAFLVDFVYECLQRNSRRPTFEQIKRPLFYMVSREFYFIQIKSSHSFDKTAKVHSSEEIIIKQIQFVNYLFDLLKFFAKGPIRFLMIKQTLIILWALKEIANKKDPFGFFQNNSYKKLPVGNQTNQYLQSFIDDQDEKHKQLLKQFLHILKQNSQEINKMKCFNDSLNLSQAFVIEIVQRCFDEIKSLIQRTHLFDLQQLESENDCLLDQQQQIMITLHLLTNYYQANCLLMEGFNDLQLFTAQAQKHLEVKYNKSKITKKDASEIYERLEKLELC